MSEQFENNEKNENITPQKTDKKTNPMLPIYIGAAAILISAIIIIGVVIYNAFLKPEPDAEYLFNEKLLCVKNDGKWGYVNKKGEYVIEPKFDVAYNFTENGLALVGQYDKDGELYYGYINKKGETVIDTEYSAADSFLSFGLAKVRNKDGKCGVIDEKGNLVLECEYKVIEIYEDVIIASPYEGNACLFNKKGEYLNSKYDRIYWLNNVGLMVVDDGDKVGIINENGKEILKMTDDIDGLGGFNSDGIGCYRENNKFGIITIKGKKITDAIYDDFLFFTENGLSPFKKDGQWGIINSRGKVVLEPGDYRSIYSLDIINYGSESYALSTHGFIATSNDEKSYFFFDEYGKEMFSVNEDTGWRYTDYIFSDNGLLPVVNKEGYYGYINRKGEIAISLDYSVAHSFSDCGIARVYTLDDDQYKFINKKGKTVGEGHAYVSNCYNDGYAIAIDLIEGEVVYKVVDKKGKTVCELDCDDVMLPDGESIMKKSSVISYLVPYSESGRKEFLVDYVRKNLSEEKLEKYGYDSAEEYVEDLFSRMTDSQISQMFIVILKGETYFK